MGLSGETAVVDSLTAAAEASGVKPLEIIRDGIPLLSDVKEEKTKFLNNPKNNQAVRYHLRQGQAGLSVGLDVADDGEIHFPPDNQALDKNTWVLEQRDGRLFVSRDGKLYGKKEGYSEEDLQNAALVLPGVGVSYFNSHEPATDPNGTSVGIFRVRKAGVVPPVRPPTVPEDKDGSKKEEGGIKRFVQRIWKEVVMIPPLIGGAPHIPGSSLPPTVEVGNPSEETGGGELLLKVPPVVGTPKEKISVSPGFDHPHLKEGESFKGLTEHWLGILADDLKIEQEYGNRPDRPKSLFDKEMEFRTDPALKGIKHFESDEDRDRMDGALKWMDKNYPGFKQYWLELVRKDVEQRPENQGKQIVQGDVLKVDTFYTSHPLGLFGRALSEYQAKNQANP